jgi:hypothetical protein
MPAPIGPKTPVTHRAKPWRGTGLVIRLLGITKAEVKWPGPGLACHEHLADLDPAQFPMAWPLPVDE